MKVESTFKKAVPFLLAFLGVGFFAAALNRFLGWNAEQSGWKSGAVTLGAAVLAFVGFRAFGGAKYANMILVGGLAAAGVQFFAAPVNSAGEKLGDWIRGWGGPGSSKTIPGPSPSASSPAMNLDNLYNEGPLMATQGQGPVTSTAPAAPAAQPTYNVSVEAAKIPKPNIGLELAKIGGDVLGKILPGLLGGSAGSGNTMNRRALASY